MCLNVLYNKYFKCNTKSNQIMVLYAARVTQFGQTLE